MQQLGKVTVVELIVRFVLAQQAPDIVAQGSEFEEQVEDGMIDVALQV